MLNRKFFLSNTTYSRGVRKRRTAVIKKKVEFNIKKLLLFFSYEFYIYYFF